MPLPKPPPIETHRLHVRLVTPADLPDLMAVNGDAAVTHHLPYATWQTLADGQAWFDRAMAQQATGTAWQLVLQTKATATATATQTACATVIGTCLLFRFDDGSARAELGYVLGRAWWGQGLMREALRGVLSTAFAAMGVRRVEAEVNPANMASMRVVESLGFVAEGTLRQRWVKAGKPYDVVLWGLLKSDQLP
jgi:[ribosomal protein S5]-alanine N-acetyltransferase